MASRGLGRYIVIRALLIIPMILILYTVVFFFLRILPGDPILAVVGTKNIPPAQLEHLRQMAGLDKPLWYQYFDYLTKVFTGNFGVTLASPSGKSVTSFIAQRFPATLELTIWGFGISVLLGIITGVIGARMKGTKVDTAMRLYSIFVYTLFIPWFGMMLQYFFGVYLHILPTSGRIAPGMQIHTITGLYVLDSILTGNWPALVSSIKHLILPALTLGIVLSGAYTRLVRNNMVEVLSMDFIRSYHARGVRGGKVLWYALKNAFIPVITLMGLQFAILLGGAVLTETTFSWPGMGTFLMDRISYRDYTSIQGTVIFIAIFIGVISLIVDIVYALLDPRVKY
ncbi:ABC-type dipeptide/oligopeptide/nickel transport system, permease component [Aciduliprofundum sp. MAR08-339]|uniref:ABC transporter permease n=1 Tax=Aciduliprofundum sp. (strain MAR08-339) TaxID=673860 RepID=UPI0002A4A63B|nr:ABC-type dipeptide/oligopeptide/nickel transport system, permease component [Aciduliprofundum sp. MAR08-339]